MWSTSLGALTRTSWWPPFRMGRWHCRRPRTGHALPQAHEVEHDPSPSGVGRMAAEGHGIAERLERVKHKLATTLLVVAALVVATLTSVTTTSRPALAAPGTGP